MNLKTTTLFALLLICASLASGYRYLVVLHFSARSHFIVGSALVKGLAEKGHEVHVISPFEVKPPPKNYHHISTPNVIKAMEKEITNILDTLNNSVVENVIHFHDMGVNITRIVLEEPAVQSLMKSDLKFDAVICEVFLGEALYGLSDHFKAPLIGLGTFGAHNWNTDMVGSPSPPSYVPSAMLQLTDHMTLGERIINLSYQAFERILLDFWYLPKQEAVFKQYFSHLKRSLHDIRRNAALVLLNSHVSLSHARPYVPNQIEVGGMHVNRQRKPLPADIQKFINESQNGVIYFSMGSNLKSKDLPLDKRAIILNTFRALKQRILWKFENPNLDGKPANVLISDWFPQDDILAHPNVKLFITHGGLLSTTETIYHGKPIVGIPIFGDQPLNMARAEKYGYGIRVDYFNLTEETFKSAIMRVLNEPSYAKRVKEVSERFRDQDMLPLDRAVYWVEHVTRHKGASYMHCAGQDLSFIEYHNIDAIAIMFGVLLSLLLLLLFLVIWLIRFLWWLLQSWCAKQQKVKTH